MTKSQELLLNEIKEKLKRNQDDIKRENISEDCDWWWVVLARKNQLSVKANTKSLQALESEGYIKIISHQNGCYGMNYDIIEILQK